MLYFAKENYSVGNSVVETHAHMYSAEWPTLCGYTGDKVGFSPEK